MTIKLLDEKDLQIAFASYLRKQRESQKLSRQALAERILVPAATIKKFEQSGQISFRQLLLLWQSLDDLNRLYQLTQSTAMKKSMPKTIEEVLKGEF